MPELGFEKESHNAIFIHDLKLNIKIINSGNCTARIAAIAYGDKNTGEPIIRDLILGKRHDTKLEITLSNDFYAGKQILPKRIKDFEIVSDIADMVDDTIVRHFMIIYANEANMYFDTYFWVRFKFGEVDSHEELQNHDEGFTLEVGSEEAVLKSQHFVIDILDTNFMTYIYKADEREILSKKIANAHKNKL